MMGGDVYLGYFEQIIIAVSSAVILIASLAWGDVVKKLQEMYFPLEQGETIISQIIYACILTLFAILSQVFIFKKLRKKIEDKKNNNSS